MAFEIYLVVGLLGLMFLAMSLPGINTKPK
jgi:hypothetical protein